jgi:hypothetical protein
MMEKFTVVLPLLQKLKSLSFVMMDMFTATRLVGAEMSALMPRSMTRLRINVRRCQKGVDGMADLKRQVPETYVNRFGEAEDREDWVKFFSRFDTVETISFISYHNFLDGLSAERVVPDMLRQANEELDRVEFWTNTASIVRGRDFLVREMRYHEDRTRFVFERDEGRWRLVDERTAMDSASPCVDIGPCRGCEACPLGWVR